MARTSTRQGYPAWLLVGGPIAALFAVVGAWAAIDSIGAVGPLDRAKLGWLVGVPLTLLVQVVAAWAGGRLGPAGRPILAAILGLGAGLAVGWPFWVEYSSHCAAAGLPIPVAPIATLGSIVGLTLAGAVLAAGVALDVDRSDVVRLALAFVATAGVFVIGFAIVVLSLMSLFFGECVVRPQITP